MHQVGRKHPPYCQPQRSVRIREDVAVIFDDGKPDAHREAVDSAIHKVREARLPDQVDEDKRLKYFLDDRGVELPQRMDSYQPHVKQCTVDTVGRRKRRYPPEETADYPAERASAVQITLVDEPQGNKWDGCCNG